MPPPPRAPAQVAARQSVGLVGATLRFLGLALVTLAVSLIAAIAVAWVGMTVWWPEQGAGHALAMLEAELGHVAGIEASLLVADPPGFAADAVRAAHTWLWQKTGLLAAVEWIGQPPPAGASAVRRTLHGITPYLVAAIAITELFAVRLAVLVLSLPVFVLFGLVGLADGLVERDLRKWGGGRESSYVFHLAKGYLAPAIFLAWAIYLSLPVSVEPALIILPFAALFAVALRITAASFKKYV
jgi:integrating conjugative element membrane protein (TIGR03747 family)